jgi:hypothetical protein
MVVVFVVVQFAPCVSPGLTVVHGTQLQVRENERVGESNQLLLAQIHPTLDLYCSSFPAPKQSGGFALTNFQLLYIFFALISPSTSSFDVGVAIPIPIFPLLP